MSNIDLFQEEFPSLSSYWRSLILFGRNTASYKFAFSKALLELAKQGITEVSLEKLAEIYSKELCLHLQQMPKQTTGKNGPFLKACLDYNNGLITKENLILATEKHGFNYVIDAFPIVNDKQIPLDFYQKDFSTTKKKLILTDNMFKLVDTPFADNFVNETEARWHLVETAWDIGVSTNLLNIKYDENSKLFFIGNDNYLKRKDITSARDALNGYQKGKCFYCFDDISTNSKGNNLCDVDHFFPHTLKSVLKGVNLDGIWNLVLSCNHCNRGDDGKFAKVPAIKYIERLYKRNEFLISSHHPLRETLIAQTGKTSEERKKFLKEVDKIAINHLIHRWEVEPVGEEIF